LIQYYGNDNIREHSNKTLDIKHNTNIINYRQEENLCILKEFGNENINSNFDWNSSFGDKIEILIMLEEP
jgi:hypothetical protein